LNHFTHLRGPRHFNKTCMIRNLKVVRVNTFCNTPRMPSIRLLKPSISCPDIAHVTQSLFGLVVGLLRKLDPENQVTETVAVHALACASSICAVCVRNESEALGAASLAVLGQEDTSDTTVALEDLAEVVLFGEFGNL
jgi:hypothetical protein